MGDEICKRPIVEVDDTHNSGTAKVAKIAAATNTKNAGFAGGAAPNPLAERPSRLPHRIKEATLRLPTQLEVDTYINSLEHELQGCEYRPEQPGNEQKRGPSINDRPPISAAFLFGLLAIAAGCFWWLAKIILEAVD